MSIEAVRKHFEKFGLADKIREFKVSSATVTLAAEALGVAPACIAKTLSFKNGEDALLVVCAGDAKIDNKKFKAALGFKAKMLAPEEAVSLVGHAVGGVCPFGIKKNVAVYLDTSLQRFQTVFPACGSSNSAIELSCDALFRYAGAQDWVDVCKIVPPAEPEN